ncbi:unnamed protein product [Caretta caretta]
MSTLPAGSAGSDRSIGDRFITSSVVIHDRSAVDSGTPPQREAEAESTGERQPSIPHGEDANHPGEQHFVNIRVPVLRGVRSFPVDLRVKRLWLKATFSTFEEAIL